MLETILEITLCISLYEMSKWIVSVLYDIKNKFKRKGE